MQENAVVHHPTYGPALPALNWIPAPRYLMRRNRVLHHLRDTPPCRVIDIGCGPATLLSELSERGFDTYGVDRSPQALDMARNLQTDQLEMTLMSELDPAWKGTFDLMLSLEVIEHLQDDIGAMQEWREYLKPGGRMILSTPAHPSRWNAADEWAGHVRRYERQQLADAVEAAGYTVERIECYGFPLANVMELWRARVYGRQNSEEAKSDKSADTLTNESGTDRSAESRYWTLFASPAASLVMRGFCQIQRPFLQTDFGNGFLVIASAR